MNTNKKFNHPCYESINDVALSCESYFKASRVNFFGHVRVYKDGQFFFLCSGHEWPRWGFGEKNMPPIGYANFNNLKNGIHFPVMQADDPVLGWSPDDIIRSKEQFGIHNPMFIVKHYGGFYDGFIFNVNSTNPHETYIRNIDSFYSFIHHHKDSKHKLITKVSNNLLKVDKAYLKIIDNRPSNDVLSYPCLQSKHFYIYQNKQFIRITLKEFRYLSLLAKGATAKAIAQKEKLSTRTVEKRLSLLKDKLYCYSKLELIHIFWKNFSEHDI